MTRLCLKLCMGLQYENSFLNSFLLTVKTIKSPGKLLAVGDCIRFCTIKGSTKKLVKFLDGGTLLLPDATSQYKSHFPQPCQVFTAVVLCFNLYSTYPD